MKLTQIRVDGYKNLIDCTYDFGDFNILVGSNNSGKSNFLEIFQLLFSLFLGPSKSSELYEKLVFARHGIYFSELAQYKNKGLTLEVTYNDVIDNKMWKFNYKAEFERKGYGLKDGTYDVHIKHENLEGKPLKRPGPTTFILNRTQDQLSVLTSKGTKQHEIGRTVSSMEFLRSVYPDGKALGEELIYSIVGLSKIARSKVFALYPDLLRNEMGTEETAGYGRIPYFDILLEIEKIHSSKHKFASFKQTLCHIMEFENIDFSILEIHAPDDKQKKTIKQLRSLLIKKPGCEYASVESFSDGTLMVISILCAVLTNDEDSIICIEEMENHLHPAAAERLLKFLQEQSTKKSILITTHSPYVLNGVDPKQVTVAIVDEKTGATHFENPGTRKQLYERLKHGYMSFGDLLVNNFQDVLSED